MALKSIQHFMTGTATVLSQNFDYYNYYVMCNFVFDEPEAVIQNGYTYEENGVLYCTSATQKGVYCYTYARNNPLMYTDPSGELFWLIPVAYIVISGAINVATHWEAIKVASQDGGGAGFGKAMGFFAIGAANGAVSFYCPALAPIVGIGTGILNQGLDKGFNNINYGQIFLQAAISIGTSAIGNGLVNSTLGKADFFTKTLAGNMIKGAISKNISAIGTNLIMGGIYGDLKERWDNYKKTGWWQATLEGMNDGMKTHYQTNSSHPEDRLRREYQERMSKDKDFRKDFSKMLKNDDLGIFSKADRFQLNMYRLNLYISNPFSLINTKPDPALIINATYEPPIPTIHIPNNWEIWEP